MNQLAQAKTLVSLATVITTDSTSGIVTLPVADVYTFTLSTGTATGTSPTCDVVIQNEFGSTASPVWISTGLRFAQHTGTASLDQITVNQTKNMLSETVVTAATGGAAAKNTALTKRVRFLVTIGGTNPSYATIVIYMVAKTFAP